MPVQTFASFVTEQAVGIAIGVVAVVAARKVGPRLATVTQNSRYSSAAAVSAKLGAVVVAKPVKTAGQVIYEQVAGSVQWYGEQWEDLIGEAYAWRTTAIDQDGSHTANILAGLSGAKIVCDLPGRLRLRLSPLKGDEHLAAACTAALVGTPGINQVQVSPHSGSILICYDPGLYASSDSLRQALAAGYISARSPEPHQSGIRSQQLGISRSLIPDSQPLN